MNPKQLDKMMEPISSPKSIQNWVLWTTGLFFSIIIGFYGYYSHANFQKHIVDNFNREQAALVQALGTVIKEYVTEASQDIQQLTLEIESSQSLDFAGEAIHTTYLIHKNGISAIILFDQSGRILSQIPDGKSDVSFQQQLKNLVVHTNNNERVYLTKRFPYQGENAVGLLSPIQFNSEKTVYLLGILGIESYINTHISGWLGQEPSVVLTNNKGDILTLYNPGHTGPAIMSKGNIRSLSETCLSCHQMNDFLDIQESSRSESVTHSVFQDPNGALQNRTTTSFTVLNEIWSISVFSPYKEVQGAIRKNYRNLLILSVLTLIIIVAFSHRVFTVQKHRAILETEAKNLRIIAESSEALRESEEKFRSVIEQSNDGIYVIQGDRFVFTNPRFSELTGYTSDEIQDTAITFKTLLAPEGLELVRKREEQTTRGEKPPNRFVIKGKRKDGQKRDFEVSITPVKWGNADAILGVMNDVTDRIEDQRILEEALAKARAGERVKTLFLENVSHEIRTPLNSILGFSDLIEERVKKHIKPEDRILFETLRKAGERLLHTVHEILEISQIESENIKPHFQKHDLVKILTKITSDYKNRAEVKHLKLHFKPGVKNAHVWCDEYSLTMAISNLVDNAIKYTHDGTVEIELMKDNVSYRVEIRDTGVGMSEEFMERMFDIFTQESEGYTKRYQGLGLGLAIAKRYFDLNQVSIHARSRKEKGTTFTLTFRTYQTKTIGEKSGVNSITT
jgi:PAS domain S-box-containing protein